MTQGYLTTRDVCARYGIGRSTLYRWMDRRIHPFPQPAIRGNAGHNRWSIEDVEHYDARIAA